MIEYKFRELHPALRDDLDQFKEHLRESNKELAPLKVWQLQGLLFNVYHILLLLIPAVNCISLIVDLHRSFEII